MSLRKLISNSVLPAALAIAAGAQAGPAAADAPCTVGHYAAITADPYRMDLNVGFDTYGIDMGVQMFVPAETGLTAEWLTRDFQAALAGPSSGRGERCRPNVRDIKVTVVSAGNGFWVLLTSTEEHAPGELLRWARQLVASSRS